MRPPAVDVLNDGAVVLGDDIVCDGYAPNRGYRVQTHVHVDHMANFDRSKGTQDIYLSPETRKLLIKEFNADLEFRTNLVPVNRGDTVELMDGLTLRLLPSNHMLGSCQVAVQLPDGRRLGYSGDFGWPLEEIIEVDELVVDSTYGSPRSVRHYTQAEAESSLMEVVLQQLRQGCVHIRAHRGTIERVLPALGGDIGVPVLASNRLIDDVSIYEQHGFAIGALISVESEDGIHAMKQRSYVRLYAKGDQFSNELICGGTTIICSAYRSDGDDPLRKFSDRAFSIALSNHADFEETIEFVKATNAKLVVTDNTRNHGQELAIAINQRLDGVVARVSTNQEVREGLLMANAGLAA